MPTIKIAVFTKEGFTSGYGLVFDNGAILKTHGVNFLWAGQEAREKATADFWGIVDQLKAQGFKIEGEEARAT